MNAYDDMSAELRCIVKAYPEPEVKWTYQKNSNASPKKLRDVLLSTVLATNKYEYSLKVCWFFTFLVSSPFFYYLLTYRCLFYLQASFVVSSPAEGVVRIMQMFSSFR